MESEGRRYHGRFRIPRDVEAEKGYDIRRFRNRAETSSFGSVGRSDKSDWMFWLNSAVRIAAGIDIGPGAVCGEIKSAGIPNRRTQLRTSQKTRIARR
jgi:hypothetical protein